MTSEIDILKKEVFDDDSMIGTWLSSLRLPRKDQNGRVSLTTIDPRNDCHVGKRNVGDLEQWLVFTRRNIDTIRERVQFHSTINEFEVIDGDHRAHSEISDNDGVELRNCFSKPN